MHNNTMMSETTDDDSNLLSKLPEDIILLHILTKLPLKALIHLISVSKQFKSLIRNRQFIESRLSCTPSHPKYLLSCSSGQVCISYSQNNPFSWNFIRAPFRFPKSSRLVGNSVRGVVCVNVIKRAKLSYTPKLILWNPLVLKVRVVPNTSIVSSESVYFGFGFDHVNLDFKVVKLSFNFMLKDKRGLFITEAMVYGAKSGRWKTVEYTVPCYVVFDQGSVFVNGFVYWLAVHKSEGEYGVRLPCLMGFDIVNEVFKVISLPPSQQYHYHLESVWNTGLTTSADGKSVAVFLMVSEGRPTSSLCKKWNVWYFNKDSAWQKQYGVVSNNDIRPLYILDDGNETVLVENADCTKRAVKGGERRSAVAQENHTIAGSSEFGYTSYTPSLEFLLDN